MAEHFHSSYISCLDEAMIPIESARNCPGHMYVPSKRPHPNGNMVNAIACAKTKIIYHVELAEGKDHPSHVQCEFEELGATTALMLRMTRRIWSSGDVVIMDSRFATLSGLLNLLAHGVYATIAIKKKRYWPREVPGDEMEQRMEHARLGACFAQRGLITTSEGTTPHTFHLVALKDMDFVAKYMTTWGSTAPSPNCTRIRTDPATGNEVTFQLPELLKVFHSASHAVDDNNHIRQGSSSLEAKSKVCTWYFKHFLFLLALSETNALLAFNHFVRAKTQRKVTLRDFRARLAEQLLTDALFADGAEEEDEEEEEPSRTPPPRPSQRFVHTSLHELKEVPPYRGVWDGKEFTERKNRYNPRRCRGPGCTKTTRCYCACDPNVFFCKDCFYTHHKKS